MPNPKQICDALLEDEVPPSGPEPDLSAGADEESYLDTDISDLIDLSVQHGGSRHHIYQTLLGKANGRPSKKIANNTYVYVSPGKVRLRLHATDIVIASEDGRVEFDMNGYQTVTTRDRMNEVLSLGTPWFICQIKGGAYWGRRDRDAVIPYNDGDWINADSDLTAQAAPEKRPRR